MSVFKRNFQFVVLSLVAFLFLSGGHIQTASASACDNNWGGGDSCASNEDGGDGSSGLTIYTLQACGVRQDYLVQEGSCSAVISQCYEKASTCLKAALDLKVKDFTAGLDPSKNWKMMVASYSSEKERNAAVNQCETAKNKQLIENACKPGCGNGILEPGEYCDGSNNPHGGTCADNCKSSCGDNFISTGIEQCDGGSDCSTQCVYTGSPQNLPSGGFMPFPDPASFCGDGQIGIHEECDHGNLNGKSGDSCTDQCKFLVQKAVDFGCMDAGKDECEAKFCSKTALGNLLCNEKLEGCLQSKEDSCEIKPSTGNGKSGSQTGNPGNTPGSSGNIGTATGAQGNFIPTPAGTARGGCSLSGLEDLPKDSFGIAGFYLAVGAFSLGLSLKKRFFS